MINSIKYFLSKFSRFGTCRECGISWTHTDHMEPVEYSEASAAFPLCKNCFEELTVEEICRDFENMYMNEWDKEPNIEHFEIFKINVERRKSNHE